MSAYLVRRLIHVVLVLIGISIITFLILHALPHDPARQVAGRTASAEQVEQVRHELGLDLPLPLQYWRYAEKLAQGDLGRSYVQRTQVSELIASRLPATLLLMLGAIFCELLIGLTAGAVAAFRRNTGFDQGVMLGALLFVSTPQFLIAYILLYVFGFWLGWVPLSGYGRFENLILPALSLGLIGGGWYARMMRSSIIEVLRQDYVRTARAKGLRRARIVPPTCGAERPAPDHRHGRPGYRLLHERHRGRGIGVRLARDRPAGLAGHSTDRHTHYHGGDAGGRLCHRARQSAGRPRGAADRS